MRGHICFLVAPLNFSFPRACANTSSFEVSSVIVTTDFFPMTSNRMYLNRLLNAFSSASSLTSSVEEELELGFLGLVYCL